jgi:hypothetical protein
VLVIVSSSVLAHVQPVLLNLVKRIFIVAFADPFTILQSHAGLFLINYILDFLKDDPL